MKASGTFPTIETLQQTEFPGFTTMSDVETSPGIRKHDNEMQTASD